MAQSKKRESAAVTNNLVQTTREALDRTPRHDVNEHGRHRIVFGEMVSQWFGHQQVATLKVGPTVYHAATDYFHGSLPSGVFTTRSVK